MIRKIFGLLLCGLLIFVSVSCKGGDRQNEDYEGGPRIIVLRYLQGTGSTEARAKGFIDSAKKAGANILADPYPAGGAIEGSKKTASNVLENYISGNKLQVDGVFACNLVSTLGMASALEDLRKSGVIIDVKFVGFDYSTKLVSLVQEGKIDALVAQKPRKMGYMAVDVLVKHLKGEEVKRFYDTGVELITKESLQNNEKIRRLVGLEKNAGPNDEPEVEQPKSDYKIAVIPKSTGNDFWNTVEDGAKFAAKKHGVAMFWEGTISETEIAEQNKIIENMMNKNLDGMALAPLDEKVMAKSVENVVEAGIPVVIFDSKVATDKYVSFVATDNEAGGRLGAEHLMKIIGNVEKEE